MEDTKMNLQLFAGEGGAQGGAQGADGTQGTEGADGAAESEAEKVAREQAEHAEKWNSLIKGDYKEDYEASIKKQLDRRFAHQAEMEAELEGNKKLLSFLSDHYQIDASDPEGLMEALQNDNALFEQQAAERGLSVDQYKEVKKLEFENALLQEQQEEAERQRAAEETYTKWIKQAEVVSQMYPNFDLETELENADFTRLLQSGVTMQAAYQAVHMDDILAGAMTYAAKNVAAKVTDGIRAKGMRPLENGIGSSSQPVKEVVDLNKLSLDELKEFGRRAGRGEKITFR